MKKLLIFITITILIITGCSNQTSQSSPDPLSKTNFFFDTVVTVTLYDSNDETIIDGCFDLCSKYENLFSRTIETSEISAINNSVVPVTVSDETIEIINDAKTYSELSEGKFDISVAALSELWNFSANSPSVPADANIKAALSTLNYRNILIDGNTVNITTAGTKIDLGAIAKGFIADKLKEYLLSQGVKSAIINLGGNILMVGSKIDGTDFNIGIQKPFAERNEVLLYVKGKDLSVVSSGVYERYFYENNVLYHHILDTATGYPVQNGLLSVTIISLISVQGDGLSTSCYAMGPEKGMELIESLDNVEAVFVDKDYNVTYSSGLEMNGDTLRVKE